ncbi:CatB-related O-acetyltransferase [Staphylococcus sp. SS251]|nr:CatB-related O-acetyltransferase [Staphylococcus singaporensis]MBE5672545.1 CatB-related O-acetyltransferase [Staphylococcus singaporensis]MBE5677710.1 CatB-related O-acetyltransferase [Staphylococcus singaporensis]
MKIAIKKIMELFKNHSSKESNIKIHRLAYVTSSKFDGNNYVDRFCKIRNSHIGSYSYVGFSSDFNNVEIGKYCSISSDVKIGLGKHPIHLFSSSPIFYSNNNPFNIKQKITNFNDHPNRTIIKNDVWIGANVIIMDGLKIDTGAIIAAGSVVTKNVGAYEVVGGVPAQVIKKRFDDKTIEELLKSRWWEETPEILKAERFSIENLKKDN